MRIRDKDFARSTVSAGCFRLLRIPMLMLVVIIMTVLPALSACAGPSPSGAPYSTGTSAGQTKPVESTGQPTGQATPQPSSLPSGIPAVSGPLRLFCTPRATLNPLADRSESFKHISQLIYEGLYRIDHAGVAQSALAGSSTVSSDGLSVDIKLAAGRIFHDGTKITAQDVAASFAALQQAGTDSAYSGSYPEIAMVSAVDTATVRIGLTNPQPDFAWQLIFPIVPAAGLTRSQKDPLFILPGTGPYAIRRYQAGEGLVLALNDRFPGSESQSVKQILVREFKDRHQAMIAFERDEIDLIDLPPEDYTIYSVRNGLRLERYWSSQYVFIAFKCETGSMLANRDRLAAVKSASHDPRLLSGTDQLGIYPAAVPVLPDNKIWSDTKTGDPDYAALYEAGALFDPDPLLAYPTSRTPLVILAPQEDTLRSELANRLAALLKEQKILADVRIMPAEAYLAARLDGQYDILMAQAIVPASMNPLWLIGPFPDAAVSGSGTLSRIGLPGYTEASSDIYRLYQSGAVSAASQEGMAADFRQTAMTGPFTGIGFRYAALCSGDRVLGQVRPDMHHLYEGIGELWIWSTSSS